MLGKRYSIARTEVKMGNVYYWLKLKHDFFDSKRIKKLRRLDGGDTNIIIYLKMQLLALKNEGILTYTGLEDTFAEEIALDINEDAENVQATINYLLRTGLMTTSDDIEFELPYVVDNTGSETQDAIRAKRWRESKKDTENQSLGTKALQMNKNEREANAYRTEANKNEQKTNVEIEIEKEIEIEIDNISPYIPQGIETDIKKENSFSLGNEPKEEKENKKEKEKELKQGFAEFWKIYPKKIGKASAEKTWLKIKPSAELVQTILDAVQTNINGNQQWIKDKGQFIPYPATWLNRKQWNDEIAPVNLYQAKKNEREKYNDMEGCILA